WEPLTVHAVLWTPGAPVAARIEAEAHRLLDTAGRRLNDKWHDVPARFAVNALVIAATKLKLPTFSHSEMIRRCAMIERERLERLRVSWFRSDRAEVQAAYPVELEPIPRKRKRRKRGHRRGGLSLVRAAPTRTKPGRDHPFR